jgi:hypothetical protein
VVVPHWPRHWQCTITIGMPLRTAAAGPIPRSHAVAISAAVAADVARDMEPDYDMPTGLLCIEFRNEVLALFKSRYPLLGATVSA